MFNLCSVENCSQVCMFSFSISTFSESTVISRVNPNVLSTVFTNEKGEMLVGQPCHVNKVTSEQQGRHGPVGEAPFYIFFFTECIIKNLRNSKL